MLLYMGITDQLKSNSEMDHIAVKQITHKTSPVTSQWILLFLALVIIGCTIGVNIYKEHQDTGMREQDRLLTQNKVISENISKNLEATNSVLSLLQEESYRTDSDQKLNERLRLIAEAMPGVRTIIVLNKRGDVVASSKQEVLYGKNFSHRDYFQTPLGHPDRSMLYISQPFQTLTGVYTINVTRIIPGSDGKFAGVITASLDPEYFTTLLSSVLYSKDMFAVVTHYDGTKILATSNAPEWVGTNRYKPETFFLKHRNSGLRTTIQTGKSAASGRDDMAAFSTVQHATLKFDKPLVITTSRSLTNIYELWRRDALIQAELFMFFALFSLFGFYFYQKRQKEYEKRNAESTVALLEKTEELDRFFSLALDLLCIVDNKGHFRRLNAAWESTLGFSIDELTGARFLDFIHPEDMEATLAAMNELSNEKAVLNFVNRYRCKDDSYRWIEWRTHPYGTELVYAAARDITEHRQARVALEEINQRLETLSMTDGLTGIANRRCFDEVMTKEYARHFRSRAELSLILLDIDFFKAFNDTYGHVKGDECLQRIAKVIAGSTTRVSDLVARYGGEEFACILPETGLDGAVAIAEKIRNRIMDLDIPHKASEVADVVTASLGVVTVRCSKDNSIANILTQADGQLYRAKSSGRNRVKFVVSDNMALSPAEENKGYLVQLVWKDSFCCGNQLIDSQHRSLFNISNELLEAILLSHPNDEISLIVSRLLENITEHFHDEELFLESIGFTDLTHHAEEHARLLKKGLQLAQEFTAHTLTVGNVFQFLVSDVVEHHLIEVDREFFSFIG